MAAPGLTSVEQVAGDSGSTKRPQITPCPYNFHCLPEPFRKALGDSCDQLVLHHAEPFQKGTRIFLESDAFVGLYAVRSGCVKKYRLHNNGEEQIVGFYFRGDLLGLSGVGSATYRMTAETLDTTSLCEIPFDRLLKVASEKPEVQHKFYQLLNQSNEQDQWIQRVLRTPSSAGRLAAFLVYMSDHFCRRGFSSTRIRLPMSRTEIGDYLGITVETVSRTLSMFDRKGVLRVDNREIEISNTEELQRIAGLCFI